MKHILLAVTGASPQVLTETLYGLHISGKPYPDEIFIITTKSCKDKLVDGLFLQGQLQALEQEYDLPKAHFNEDNIWLIEDDNGHVLCDAKSIEDQTIMADFITQKVFELTSQKEIAIHASIAGGRKTMAFYLGYAMSLLGREQDTLSHVFISDEFEFVPDFWFPTKESQFITGKKSGDTVDTSKAVVTLAEIPFVRMRHSVNPQLIQSIGSMSFSQTVATLNASHSKNLQLTLNNKARTLSIVGISIKLTPKEFAFYLWLTDLAEKGLLVDRYFEENNQNSLAFLKYYRPLASDIRVFKTFGITPEDFTENSLSQLQGMDREFVQTQCSNINRKLKKSLPSEIAYKITIRSQQQSGQTCYKVTCASKG